MGEPTGFIIGFLAGIVTNLLVWWALFHVIVPKIQFSPFISKLPTTVPDSDNSGFRYRFKMRNGGRRGIIDVELNATLRIEGLTKRKNFELIGIPLTTDGERRARINRLPRVRPGVKAARVYRLYINSVEELSNRSIYPEHIRRKAEERALTLEDLLVLGDEAYLQIAAFGYDEFSGARKLFLSKYYMLSHVKTGEF